MKATKKRQVNHHDLRRHAAEFFRIDPDVEVVDPLGMVHAALSAVLRAAVDEGRLTREQSSTFGLLIHTAAGLELQRAARRENDADGGTR